MKDQKKKLFLALLLALSLLLGGCGEKGETPPPEESPVVTREAEGTSLLKEELPEENETAETPEKEAPPAQMTEKPAPAEEKPEKESASPVPAAESCTVSISCAELVSNEALPAEKAELVPADGWLLPPTEVELSGGESAFDVLQAVCRSSKIHMEFSGVPLSGSAYIEGIGNLYEFDCGEQSGWLYRVNGKYPNFSSSGYTMQDGDTLEWIYSCEKKDLKNAA